MYACGNIGLANQKCNYECSKCKVKCDGKYASSFKTSIGKEEFHCSCAKNCTNSSIAQPKYVFAENSNKRICLTM
jgi:hypothetical protein